MHEKANNQLHCYFPYHGVEQSKDQFDVLSGTGLKWVSSNFQIPNGAICVGQEGGKNVYIGRGNFKDSSKECIGKVVAFGNQYNIYCPWKGQELENTLKNHKILCT